MLYLLMGVAMRQQQQSRLGGTKMKTLCKAVEKTRINGDGARNVTWCKAMKLVMLCGPRINE